MKRAIKRKLVGEPSRVLLGLKNEPRDRARDGAASTLSLRIMETTNNNKEAREHGTGLPVVNR